MKFTEFEDGDPLSKSFQVNDGITINIVDSAFNEIKVSLFLNRGRINKFLYMEKRKYDEQTSETQKQNYAQELLDNAETYHEQTKNHLKNVRSKLQNQLDNVEISNIRPNRTGELEQSGYDPSMYVFHITYEKNNHIFRTYIGDTTIPRHDTKGGQSENYKADSVRIRYSGLNTTQREVRSGSSPEASSHSLSHPFSRYSTQLHSQDNHSLNHPAFFSIPNP